MKNFFKLLVLLIFISPCFFILSACDSGKDDRQAPVYQGMIVSSTNQSSMLLAKHINPDKPFGDGCANIEDHASSLFVLDSTQTVYYANANQDVYITIKLSNPDNFEIMSFTLNGVKYSSYMFEDGSDMENLILKVNVGNIVGVKDYTIDAIKYIDKTEIKDVVIDGDKTIKVGLGANNSTYCEVLGLDIKPDEISLNVNLVDVYNIIQKTQGSTKIVLYNGINIINSKDLVVGQNNIVFENLTPNTIYQFAVISAYDDLCGDGLKMHTLYKEAFCTNSLVEFQIDSIGQTSINYSYNWDNNIETKTIVSQELYLDETKVANIDNDETQVTDLLSNREYTIVTTYKNLENNNETITHTFTTLAKTIPNITLTQKSLTQSSFEFVIDIEDLDSIGTISKIELLHNNNQPTIINNNLREFTNLLSDNDYTVKVEYLYNLNDGSGEQSIIKELNFHTLAKTSPIVAFKDIASLQNSITFDYSLTDVDSICTVTKVELYQDLNKIHTITDLTNKTFNELTANTEYIIKLWYQYNLNDGTGTKEDFITTSYYTMATEITVTQISTLNETNPKVGEDVHVSVSFENPSNIEINAFYINGISTEVVGGNKTTSAIVKFVPDFKGGEYEISLTKISYLRNGNTLTQDISSEFTTSILILGSLNVTSFERENLKDYYTTVDDNVVIKLDNPTNYDITDISVKYNSTEKTLTTEDFTISNNIITFKVSTFDLGSASTLTLELTSITYGINGVTAKADYNLNPITLTYLTDSTVNEITTIDQLKNMQNNKMYKLMNDLDFANQTWTPISFKGVLDGNNHKIKNMTYVSETMISTNFEFALFSQVTGVVKNLEIDSIYVSIYASQNVNIAGIAIATGHNVATNCTIIENCIVTGDVYLNSDNQSQSMTANIGGLIAKSGAVCRVVGCNSNVNINVEDCKGYEVNAGGIIGDVKTTDIASEVKICSANGNITINNASTAKAGGLVGNVYEEMFISDCYTTGDITVETDGYIDIGGLVGHLHCITISNCYTTGNIYGHSALLPVFCGGLIGNINMSSIISVENCYTTGNISAFCDYMPEHYAHATSMTGVGVSTMTVTNYFSYENQKVYDNDVLDTTPSSYETVASMETIWSFVQNNWDSSVWNFYTDKNPTLK